MKTINLYTLKLLAVIIVCMSLSKTADASPGYPSVGLRLNHAGNGLAVAPAITFRYSLKRVDFDLGANFQMNEARFSGYQANMCWYVAPPTRKVRLGFFFGVRYFNSASLNKTVVAQEKWVQPESALDFDELKLKCVEGVGGFGVRVHHTLRLSSFYGIGFGAYKTLGNEADYVGMHRQVTSAELYLNFGLSFSFRRM